MEKLLAACVVMGVLACGSTEAADAPRSDSIDDEVASFLESYHAAIESRDIAVLQTLYVDDGRFQWIEDGKIRYRSFDEISEGLASLPSDFVIHTEYDDREIVAVGDAGARVSMRFRTVIGDGPSAFEFGGMMTIVLESDSTGWRIVGGHTSSERPDGR